MQENKVYTYKLQEENRQRFIKQEPYICIDEENQTVDFSLGKDEEEAGAICRQLLMFMKTSKIKK